MQIVSNGDNLHEMSNPVFWENKKNITNMSSVELAQRVVKVDKLVCLQTQLFYHFLFSFQRYTI